MLNQDTSKVLARVKAGEEITLTDRGVPIARIVPAPLGPFDDLVKAGRVRPTTSGGKGADAGTLVRVMRDEERY